MSLLMKALEKAAKDRGETDAERAPAAAGATASADASAKSELTLEPITVPPTAAPSGPPSSSHRPAAAAARKPPAAAETTRAAATVIRAGQSDAGGGAAAYVREHPMIAFGTLAALFLLGYGGYVYMQLTNPGLFAKSPPRPAQSGAIIQAPGATISGGSLTTVQPPVATTSLLPPLQAGAEKEKAAGPAAAPAPAPADITAAPAAPAPTAVRDTIKITASNATPAVNPLVSEAYAALNTGNLDAAGRLYGQVLRGEPGNLDALLGLAAIALQQGNGNQAAKYYLKVLELDPPNAFAQAGLISLLGRADPLAAETRVKLLIAREPSAFLYFTLGNVYVDQSRWPDAQQAYFQAYHLQPDNPDFAYNLAVGLEHVGQSKLALNFYRRAMQLADANGRANFSMAAAQGRISKLEKVVQ